MEGRLKLLTGSVLLLLGGLALGSVLFGVSSAAARSAGVATVPSPPATITARLITRQLHTAKPGTVVKSSALGHRVFVNNTDGFALGAIDDAQYPAKTTDGGTIWKTFGPALHVNAAQAPLAVTQVGASTKHTVYYYGSGQVVDVTNDGGKQWWQALTEELSVAVVPGASGRLVWFTQVSVNGTDANAVTWPYISTDGGKVWHYSTALGGGF
jgi:hypothetical protein